MYELIRLTDNSFYMDCPSKVGFYKTGEDEVVIIDSGSDKDAGKKVKKILDGQKWKLKAIYNTHSHADHIGGNMYLQNQTGCSIYAPGIDKVFTEYPVLEPTVLYGGKALQGLKNKFLMAAESEVNKLENDLLPNGMKVIKLPGHCFDMVGFRTDDNVVFLADCLSSEETLDKYQIGYIYDIKEYIDTLEFVKTLSAEWFVPSHASAVRDINDLAQLNIDKTLKIAETIRNILVIPMSFDELLEKVFSIYGLVMNLQQRMLVGSTVKSYLTYLNDRGEVEYYFENNVMRWKCI